MAVNFKVPKSPARSIASIDHFLGVDLTNSPANVDENKSPNAINMIRDVPGKVRKRMGYEVIDDYGSPEARAENLLMTDYGHASYDTRIEYEVKENKSLRFYSERVNSNYQRIVNVLYYKEYKLPAGNYKFVMNIIDESYSNTLKLEAVLSVGSFVLTDTTYTLNYEPKSEVKQLIADVTLSKEEVITSKVTATGAESGSVLFSGDITVGLMVVEADKYVEGMSYRAYGNVPTSLNVNGRFVINGHELLHIGQVMYKDGTAIYNDMADRVSHAWQFGNKLYIQDGKTFLVYDDDNSTIGPVADNDAYIPTTTIGKTVWGDATSYEAFNMLSRGFTETFINDYAPSSQNENLVFQLSVNDLADDPVTARVLNPNGNWYTRTEGNEFTVNRQTGVVTFKSNTPPGRTPVAGKPNVEITAYRKTCDSDLIDRCSVGIRYGINGATDRLFFANGNRDWYCDFNNPSYFLDNGYSVLGSSNSNIVGYSIVSNYLAAHKDENETEMSVIIRKGELDSFTDSEGYTRTTPSFKIVNTLQGGGAIAQESFNYLETEPIFLTRSGLYAITSQDISGEKYSQSRSFYLNGKLTQEKFGDLQNSVSCVFNNMYLLAVGNDRLYILDGLQSLRTDKSEPYSTRQYAAFYCNGLPIRTMWVSKNKLYFGTTDGRICRFYTDKDDVLSYTDGRTELTEEIKKDQVKYNKWLDTGKTIICQWETPDIDGSLFYKNKTLRYLAVRVGAAIRTSMNIYVMDRGIWKFVKKDSTFARYFTFNNLDFSKWTFKTDRTQQVGRTKLRIKKVDKFRIKLVNDEKDEPFILYNMAMEFVENGNYKG